MSIRKRMMQKAAGQIKMNKVRQNRLWNEWMESIKLARLDCRKPHEKVIDTTFEKSPAFYDGLRNFYSTDPVADCEKGLNHLHKREYDKAHECFLKAARAGYAEGQYRLGSLYMYGRGVNADYNLAEVWFRDAAQNGFLPYAMEGLSILKRFRLNYLGGQEDE